MPLTYVKHEKISLRKHPQFNEIWLHNRIVDDPTIVGLGELRVLDRERAIQGGGRLDLLLFDEDNSRRYEMEIQLGDTDPSHIIRCIEYWDVERRRYPGYEHVAVLVAENITTRFLNVMSLVAGSIPMVAIQLDALAVGEQLLLNFTQVLDQTELRVDDTEEDQGGGQADRAYWEKKAGSSLVKICDDVLTLVRSNTSIPVELNYARQYVGMLVHGVSNNFVYLSPRAYSKFTHITFRIENALTWKDRFDQAGIPATVNQKNRLRISVTPEQFAAQNALISEVVADTVKQFEN